MPDYIWDVIRSVSIVPVVAVLAGIFMWKFTPKNANQIVGYRSRRSMTNETTWKFANHYCGRLWLIFGLIIWVIAIAVVVMFKNSPEDTLDTIRLVILPVQAALLCLSIIPVELKLKKEFNI